MHCNKHAIMLTCTVATSWTKLRNHCSSRYSQSYSQLSDAKAACLKLGTNCAGVYQPYCNSWLANSLCKPGSLQSSSYHCVYTSESVGWSKT